MKKRVKWLIVMVSMIFIFSSSVVHAAETVKIGALFPFTGTLALLGNESFNGADIAADIVNEKGGLWGKKIEWVKGDAVDPKKAMTECERLISVKGMKIIFGTYSSSLAYAASEVAEKHKVIYWEQGAIADPITQRGYKYLFRFCPAASKFGIMAADFIKDVVASKLGVDPQKLRVAIMYEDSLYGTTVGSSAEKHAKEIGLQVVGVEPYSKTAVDLSPIVMRFKAAKPDVIIATSYITDALLFWRQAKDLDLNVKAFIGTGAGHGMEKWTETFGDEGDYIFNLDFPLGIDLSALNPETRAVWKEFLRRYEEKFGRHPGTHAPFGFEAARLLFEYVLPKAGSLDPEAVRKAALEIDIPEGGTVMGFGVKYAPLGHPMAGHNLRSFPDIMQWQEHKQWVVYPLKFALKKVLLPMPTWEERKKGITHFVE